MARATDVCLHTHPAAMLPCTRGGRDAHAWRGGLRDLLAPTRTCCRSRSGSRTNTAVTHLLGRRLLLSQRSSRPHRPMAVSPADASAWTQTPPPGGLPGSSSLWPKEQGQAWLLGPPKVGVGLG